MTNDRRYWGNRRYPAWWTIGLGCVAFALGWVVQCGAAETDFFENQIRPLLADRCYECHSAKGGKIKGGLALDTGAGLRKGGTSGALFVAGQPDASLIVQAVRGTAHDLKRMPTEGGPLTAEQIDRLVAWIRDGASLPADAVAESVSDPKRHWAYQKPVARPVPTGPSGAPLASNPLDAFLAAAQKSRGVVPGGSADRRTLLRRVSMDITGLPPTPAEMEAFLADETAGAYERAVDRLLASPRYGERWGRHWLDVARYADTKGYVFEEERRYPASFTYRDWVVGALNRDVPYDQFIICQIAGDTVATEQDKSPLAALGFLTLGRRFLNNQPDIIDDRLDVVFRGLQGLTVQCARCHDHKSDPIPTSDYYSLYGVFASSHEPDPKPLIGANPNPVLTQKYEAERAKREKERNDFMAAKVEQARKELRERIGDYLLAVHDARTAGDKREELIRARKLSPAVVNRWQGRLETWAKAPHPIFGPYLAWTTLPTNDLATRAPELARGYAANSVSTNRLNPLVASLFGSNAPVSVPELTARYAALFQQIEAEWQTIAKTGGKALPDADREALREVLYGAESPVSVDWDLAYRLVPTPDQQRYRALQRRLDELEATDPGAPLRAMALLDNETPVEPVVFKRGNPGNHGPKVPRQFLGILQPDRTPFKKGSGRYELAQAIASRDNPLTARVMVNRIWLEYFGAPLVRTPSDFGVKADPPVHPEILDWLAVWFMDNGWSLKKLHRLILTSEAYRRTSDPADSATRLANEGADPANVTLWRMNRKRADFEALRDSLLFVSGNLDLGIGGQAVEIYNNQPVNRRTLYGFIDRQNLPGLLRAFDFASPDTSASMRYQTTVPQQALYFLNSPFVVDIARRFAARPDVVGAGSDDARIAILYQHAFQREPEPAERVAARQFLARATNAASSAPAGPVWEYGYGRFDTNASRLEAFATFRQFKDGRWQAEADYPSPEAVGFAALSAMGGHPGRDLAHSVVRRWHAPVAGTVRIRGRLKHPAEAGDGVVARIVSSRQGLVGTWTAAHGETPIQVKELVVQPGDAIDFVIECGKDDNSDSFEWAPEISVVTGSGELKGGRSSWSAKADFSGPAPARKPLGPWDRYAQALLASNEFIFID